MNKFTEQNYHSILSASFVTTKEERERFPELIKHKMRKVRAEVGEQLVAALENLDEPVDVTVQWVQYEGGFGNEVTALTVAIGAKK